MIIHVVANYYFLFSIVVTFEPVIAINLSAFKKQEAERDSGTYADGSVPDASHSTS